MREGPGGARGGGCCWLCCGCCCCAAGAGVGGEASDPRPDRETWAAPCGALDAAPERGGVGGRAHEGDTMLGWESICVRRRRRRRSSTEERRRRIFGSRPSTGACRKGGVSLRVYLWVELSGEVLSHPHGRRRRAVNCFWYSMLFILLDWLLGDVEPALQPRTQNLNDRNAFWCVCVCVCVCVFCL